MMVVESYRPLLNNEKIEIAFLFQAGTVWPSWESVYKACLDDGRMKVSLILVTGTTVENSHNVDAEKFLQEGGYLYVKEEDIDFKNYIPHIAFIQFPYDAAFHKPDMLSLNFRLRGTRVVYIPYGIEISDTLTARKDHFNSRVVENAWRIYTSGSGIKEEYKKYCRNRGAVRVTGSPKFDSIYSRTGYPTDPEYIKRAKGRRIVVWKLHFPKKNIMDGKICMITPEIEEYLVFAEKIREYADFFFIVMPHPKILGRMTASDSQGDDSMIKRMHLLLDSVRNYENAVVDTSMDYRNSLYNADAIIMDRSAVMIEAAILDKPLLILKNNSYDEPMVRPVSDVIAGCVQGYGCRDMVNFLDALRRGDDFNKEKRENAVKKWFPYLDGKCGERIRDDLVESIHTENNANRRVSIVIYGTGEVSSYYMDKESWGNSDLFNIVAVSDSSDAKWEKEFYGYKVVPPDRIREFKYDYIVIMTEPHFYEIQSFLINDMYLNDRSIVRLDEFVTQIIPMIIGSIDDD